MTVLAITQPSADWLLGKVGLLDALHSILLSDPEALRSLSKGELVEGPFRMSQSPDGQVLAIWNADYLSGTGDEAWGFVDLSEDSGLVTEPGISREVLERTLYVINQRLQGLFIDGALIHRSYPNGSHTCLAGRGNEARHRSIGYVERDVSVGRSMVHTVICVGPMYDLVVLSDLAASAAADLPELAASASGLIAPGRKRTALPVEFLQGLRLTLSSYVGTAAPHEYSEVSVSTAEHQLADRDAYRTMGWTYDDWTAAGSPLSPGQRRLLESDSMERHPIRIVGPGGSGKTLLMQLLAIRRLRFAERKAMPVRLLYIVHNSAMAQLVSHRFSALLANQPVSPSLVNDLTVSTLADYGRAELDLEESALIDPDAYQAKEFQLEVLGESLKAVIDSSPSEVNESAVFKEVVRNRELLPILMRLVMSEISTTIKGQGIGNDRRRYVESDRSLSRFHGALGIKDKQLVFQTFQRYHRTMFEEFSVLDSDDVALSLLGRLRTPIWDLKRRTKGFDWVFVDETQLFNENERRIFSFLTKSTVPHVPIVLALDEAQNLYGQVSAGLATLGIRDAASESLASIHRSTRSIVKLAFFIIQRSTDLFGPDFPDFTGIAEEMEPDTHALASPPRIETASEAQPSIGRFVLRRIRALRKANLWQIAVICHAEQYWESLLRELRQPGLPLRVLEQRGERIAERDPVVVLSRPAHIGGQEFDAVVVVGAELGLAPPRVVDNDALATAVEQQALREFYLSITRARYQVLFALSAGATPSPILQEAERAGLIKRRSASKD